MFTDFDAILRQLPNGLHDARLHKLDLDLETGAVAFELSVWIGTLSSDDFAAREATRLARLRFDGVSDLCIWPGSLWLGGGEPIDASPECALSCPDERLRDYRGPGGVATIWCSDAATNLALNAERAEFSWLDDE